MPGEKRFNTMVWSRVGYKGTKGQGRGEEPTFSRCPSASDIRADVTRYLGRSPPVCS